MSTRSVIARKSGHGFTGVYHHWDGYPSGLGATLWEVRNKFYGGDTKRMLQYLIDLHPGGWSTINKDWSKPAEPRKDDHDQPCTICGKPNWQHYRQYYHANEGQAELSPWERAGRPVPPPGDEVLVLGHGCKTGSEETGPEPSGGKDGKITQANAGNCGCEWAYVFDGNGTMEIQSSYCDPKGKFAGEKMIGAFGCGDPKSTWKTVAVVDLDGTEPDWKAIEGAA